MVSLFSRKILDIAGVVGSYYIEVVREPRVARISVIRDNNDDAESNITCTWTRGEELDPVKRRLWNLVTNMFGNTSRLTETHQLELINQRIGSGKA